MVQLVNDECMHFEARVFMSVRKVSVSSNVVQRLLPMYTAIRMT